MYFCFFSMHMNVGVATPTTATGLPRVTAAGRVQETVCSCAVELLGTVSTYTPERLVICSRI